MQGKLTVYFDGQFWVGVFQRKESEKLQVAKLVFGPEPQDEMVYEWILLNYHKLKFGAAVESEMPQEKRINPKRRQRQVHREQQNTGVGTKAQQALKQNQEVSKNARKLKSKEMRKAKEDRIFQLKQQKKKEKHKGH